MAATKHSTMSGVKVNLVPSLFSKAALLLFLHCTRFVTSASEKLVTCGLVCTLSTICLAISLRIRSISIISVAPLNTTPAGLLAVVDGAAGAATEEAGVGAEATAGAVPDFLAATQFKISFFETLPPEPVPGIFSKSCKLTPSLCAMFKTSGE